MMPDVVIVSAVRTPIGRVRGALASVRPDDLAAHVIAAALDRAGLPPAEVDEVYLGCANQAGEDNRNVARMGALLAGLPHEVPALTFNRLCASGLSAVNHAARTIRCGEAEVIIAGGVESMSRAPYSLPRTPPAFGNFTAWDTSLGWRYPNPHLEAQFPLETMGETAENVQELSRRADFPGGEITREDQDRFALQSHARAINAINAGHFTAEIAPVVIPQRKGEPITVAIDEQPFARATDNGYELATSLEKLGRLKPAFRTGGSVTAGNASSLNDGASALVLMSASRARALGLQPLARWCGSATAGVDPRLMGLGPVDAVRHVLKRTGLTLADVALTELNEAFAVQALAVMRQLGLDEATTNVSGGAIALGHPLGCTGARLVTTLVHALRRQGAAGTAAPHGLATLCVGVGQGEATVLEAL
ncbi:thiolase family protein [Actomonas aquatica]|uniref:Thiolase family protein n=2 Tax=Actomonas aquatica TaxID=2866162 RepID=A0ABZ1CC66_9BACT|nr:thiolase family protein [Opitutus sp. WL0086]WRQ87885.1 thiolase family protein [Opitutus sp. WL0086]